MAHNAVLGTEQFSDVQVVDGTHPAIIRGKKVATGTGTLPRGRIVKADINGKMVGAATGDTPAGVLTEAVDIAAEEVCPVIVHGTVVAENLTLADGSAPLAVDMAALESLGVFPV